MDFYKSKYTGAQIEGALDTYKNTAAEYSASRTYALGAICLHDNKLYKCTTAITTAEPWTAAHWTQTYIAEYLEGTFGDMRKADYDSSETVKNAGGIPSYVSENASKVSVSASGSSSDTVQYITVDGVEKKIAGGGAFIATVNTTTFAQILSAYNSGMEIIAKYEYTSMLFTPIEEYLKLATVGLDDFNEVTSFGFVSLDSALVERTVSITSTGWGTVYENTLARTSDISAHNSSTSSHTDIRNAINSKSTVSVSASGTSTDEVQYITVDGIEKKLAGGGGGGSSEYKLSVSYPSTTYGKGTVPSTAKKYAKVKSIIGSSCKVNQLSTRDTVDTYFTVSTDANGLTTQTFTGSAYWAREEIVASALVVSGHKYFINYPYTSFTISATNWIIVCNEGTTAPTTLTILAEENSTIVTAINTGQPITNGFGYFDTTHTVGTAITFKRNAVDLTAMYGSGNEPSTVADFLYDHPEYMGYVSYTTGAIKDATITKVNSVGVNLWDEQWEVGDINSSTGQNVANNSLIRSTNYIPCNPSTTYYFRTPSTYAESIRSRFYDANKNYLTPYVSGGGTIASNSSFVPPSGAFYVRFAMQTSYGTTYNNDIQICLNSYSGKTTYHAYVGGERKLPQPITVRSASDTVRDSYDPTTGIIGRKVGRVDLGSLTWEMPSWVSGTNVFKATISNLKGATWTTDDGNFVCSIYSKIAGSIVVGGTVDKCCGADLANQFYVRDTSHSSAAAFKTAMSGVYLNFELNTPTTERVAPINPFVEVEAEGTIGLTHTESPSAESRFVTDFYTADNIDDVNGTMSNIPFSFGDLLWANASPSSAFAAQTVSVDLSNYSSIIVVSTETTSADIYCSNLFNKDGLTYKANMYDSYYYTRTYSVNSSSIVIGTGYRGTTSGTNYLIPYRIYGIK